MDHKYLPEDRLATTDEKGHRVYVHPAEVSGKWTSLRKKIYWSLILFYLFLPWIRWNGKQVILLNLPAREFTFFGTTFYGHDGPLLIFVLLGFLFLISYVTSLWGRVWCGYACPQTVFIDTLFRAVDKFIEGSARRREKLQLAKWTWKKIFKRCLKWFLFLLISLHIVHSGLGYFVGTHELLALSLHSPAEHMGLFLTMLVCTGIILVDFGWFREQFCIIACPYGRFQSIVMDENSLIVAYDEKRGEPRKRTKDVAPESIGDCVNCDRCVKVCPTGIDIREGLQMECIACTMCIDACDEIMDKVKKPRGLIRYSTENELAGIPKKTHPRVYIYLAVFILLMIGFVTSLSLRGGLKGQFLRGSSTPYQVAQELANGKKIINHYKLKLNYYHEEELVFTLKTKEAVKIIIPEDWINIKDGNKEVNVFFEFNSSILNAGEKEIELFYESKEGKILKKAKVRLLGPLH